MAAASDDTQKTMITNAAALLGVAMLTVLAGLYIYKNSNKDFLCYETNSYLNDQDYIEIMIRTIVLEGDQGGKTYRSREDYLGDDTECCKVLRDKGKTYLGLVSKPEVYVSAKYYNPAFREYMFIQRHFDACGHRSSGSLKSG